MLFACKKEILTPATDDSEDLRSWYNERTKSKNLDFSIFNNSGGAIVHSERMEKAKSLPIIPDWDHSNSYNTNDSIITEVPVISSKDYGSVIEGQATDKGNPTSFLRIVFIKTSKSESAYFMRVIGNRQYVLDNPGSLVKNTLKHKESNFSGMVLFHSLEGGTPCSN